MRNSERGSALVLVLILLALGAPLITPSLRLVNTGLQSKQIHTVSLEGQYAADAGSEFALWKLLYGDVTSQLTQDGDQTSFSFTLNGVETTVVIRLSGAAQALSSDPGAEDNRVRPSTMVECDKDNDGFDDDWLALPIQAGMAARYTVSLEQISPDTTAGVLGVYVELPKQFALVPGSVTSLDGSLPEAELISPVNIESQSWQIWKWDFSASPIYFVQGEVKQFTFESSIHDKKGRYCAGVFTKLTAPPNEKSDKTAHIVVGTGAPDGCEGGGIKAAKYVDKSLVQPNVNTIVTYIVSVENFEQNSAHTTSVEDVLPTAGFEYCSPAFPPDDPLLSCDSPMWKTADRAFDPATDSFTDTTGFTQLSDPQQTYLTGDQRWELFWDGPGGSGWGLLQAGQPNDTFLLRFQAQVTASSSGTYFNEAFADVNCSAPSSLITEGVTSQAEYCASYSWPTSGVVVPSYDLRATVGGYSAQGSASLDLGSLTAQLNSWHVN